MTDPVTLLQANLSLIDGIAARACRRGRLHDPADVEDFVSSVKVALIEDDYAVLRAWEGRSSLKTYLTIVIERRLVDQRMHTYGRFHHSTEAMRLGPAAILLDSLVRRDRRSLDEALPLVREIDPAMTRASAEELLRRLPEHKPRPVAIDLQNAPDSALVTPENAETDILAAEARQALDRARPVLRDSIRGLPLEERAIVRFRFALGMSVAEISRMLRVPQRPLYRRIEASLRTMRNALLAAGIDGAAASEILQRAGGEEMDFGLVENEPGPQSNEGSGSPSLGENT